MYTTASNVPCPRPDCDDCVCGTVYRFAGPGMEWDVDVDLECEGGHELTDEERSKLGDLLIESVQY
jgi:hypothetical protein